jgi:hypothetical protein
VEANKTATTADMCLILLVVYKSLGLGVGEPMPPELFDFVAVEYHKPKAARKALVKLFRRIQSWLAVRKFVRGKPRAQRLPFPQVKRVLPLVTNSGNLPRIKHGYELGRTCQSSKQCAAILSAVIEWPTRKR